MNTETLKERKPPVVIAKIWRKFWTLIWKHPGWVIAFAIGAAAGIVICAPLIPWQLESGAAEVIGATLGAFTAVSLAAIIADKRANDGDRDLRRTIARVIRELAEDLRTFSTNAQETEYANGVLSKECRQLQPDVDRAINRLRMLSSAAPSLKDGKGVFLVDAQLALDQIAGDLPQILTDIQKAITPVLAMVGPNQAQWKTSSKKIEKPTQDLFDALIGLGQETPNYSDATENSDATEKLTPTVLSEDGAAKL